MTDRSSTPVTAEEIGPFMTELTEIDSLIDEYNGDEAFNLLSEMESRVPLKHWIDYSHRFAKACYIRYNQWPIKEKQDERMELVKQGLEAVERAHAMDETHLEVLTQCAVLTGTLAENSSMKDKVKLGFQFKQYLDKALVQDPTHFALLHMRGRFLLQLAELNWIQKKTASMLFGELPLANYDLALEDLLMADTKVPNAIDNLLYIAKAYKGKGDKVKAREYLLKVTELDAEDTVDDEQITEAQEMLAKL